MEYLLTYPGLVWITLTALDVVLLLALSLWYKRRKDKAQKHGAGRPMSDRKKLDLDGEGFSKEPFSDEELARQRHLRHHYERHFLDADKFLDAIGLRWAATLSKSGPVLVKIISGAAVLGLGLSWLAGKGFF